MKSYLKSLVPYAVLRFLRAWLNKKTISDFIGRPWGHDLCCASIAFSSKASSWRHVYIENNVTIESSTYFQSNSNSSNYEKKIIIRSHSFVGIGCFFSSGDKIEIARGCLVGPGCDFLGAGHNYSNPYISYVTSNIVRYGAIILEENVWIGANVTILGDIKIGYGTIVAAGTVIRESIPPFCLVAGNPMKILKTYDNKNNIWEKVESVSDIENHKKSLILLTEYKKLLKYG